MSGTGSKIAVLGGGVIGMSIAWRLARRGAAVTVFERDVVGSEASRVAAGMLTVSAEVGYEEFDLYRFCQRSLELWPGFAEELQAESGVDLDYRSEGTLIVAHDRDSAEALRRAYAFQVDHGFQVRWLSISEALDIEEFLSPRIAGAVFAPEDHAVDNRQVLKALKIAFQAAGGTLRERTSVSEIRPGGARIDCVIRASDSEGESTALGFDKVVVAAGAWSNTIAGCVVPSAIRPVKGQILELRMEGGFDLQHVVRGPKAYLVPRTDGRLIVGATNEEMGYDKQATAGGVLDVLEGAWELVPGIHDLPLLGIDVGLRPAPPDHQPIIGWTDTPGVFVATGHYRHGILLSVATAMDSEEAILNGTEANAFEAFSPTRYSRSV